jgi:hypothetical protein
VRGFWQRLRRVFRHEAAELHDVVGDAVERGNAALDRKEQEMTATPEERLRLQQQRVDESDTEFDQVRRRIERDVE